MTFDPIAARLEAQAEGKQAYVDGLKLEDNPYNPKGIKGRCWNKAWERAEIVYRLSFDLPLAAPTTPVVESERRPTRPLPDHYREAKP